ncbi:MAG: cobalamin B12-binding domain-containing protein [Steroidobacteraceae bacterium]
MTDCGGDVIGGSSRRAVQSPSVQGMVEWEVVPRLAAARGVRSPNGNASSWIRREDVEYFTRCSVERDALALHGFLESLRQAGASHETLLLEVVAPAARALGVQWEQDSCDFAAVTVGVGRMQQAMRMLTPDSPVPSLEGAVAARRAWLSVGPGEQHTLAVGILGHCLRGAGWQVDGPGAADTANQPVRAVSEHWYDLVGLSVQCHRFLEDLSRQIERLRSCSCNENLRIMVGGMPFLSDPGLATEVGADLTASDAREAVRAADALDVGCAKQD